MPKPDFHFRHSASGHVTITGLQLCGQLFLGHSTRLPGGADLPPYYGIIGIIHTVTLFALISAQTLT